MKNLLKLSALNKLLKLAAANLKKSISVSIILTALFVVAALLLNAGLLVTVGYGRFFGQLKEELNTADAYYMIPDTLYTEDLTEYFDENEHVTQTRWENVLLSNASIRSDAGQGDEKSYTVLFRRAETVEGLSQWKTVGDSLPAEEMSVFIPDIFKAVGGYQLGDAINLTCPTLDGGEQTLTLTVAGFSEDIFFSSADTGPVSFYLPGETYDQLGNLLRDAVFPAQLIFTALDSVDNAVKVENGARELLNLNATSMMTPDASRTLTSMDVSLTELSRCMMASMVAVMMVVFAMILVAVCLLVVRFRIVNSIGEDMVNIGSLKSVGYSSGQIILSILLQFGVIAYIGSIIGIALSYLILPAIANIFEQQSGLRWEQGFDLILSAASYYIIMLIVILVSLLAARHVRKMTPVRALRGESSARGLKRGRLPLEKSSGNLTAALAFKSMLSDFRHSLMIFIIVTAVSFAGAFGVIMYYNTSMDTTAFAEVPGVEICNAVAILNPQTNNTETAREIEGMEHVRKVLFLDTVRLRIDGAEVSSYVMADYAEKETMSVYEGKYPEQSGEITLAGVFAQRLNKKVGDQVTAEYGDQTQVFTVTGLSSGSAMAGLTVNILTEDFERLNPVFSPSSLNVYLEDGADAAVFIEDLENSLSDDQLISAGDFDKMMSEGMMSYQSIIAALGLSMLVVTLAVITLVLYFIIGSSVVRRKQELGIQKALGFVTVQLMNQIAVGFSLPVALGVAVGCTFSALCTNPVMSVVMAGIGVMNANFAVNTLWVAAFGVGCFIFSYLVSLAVTARIRKISAYALVTGTAG